MTLHVTSSPRFEVHNFNLECATVDLGGPLGAINKRLLFFKKQKVEDRF